MQLSQADKCYNYLKWLYFYLQCFTWVYSGLICHVHSEVLGTCWRWASPENVQCVMQNDGIDLFAWGLNCPCPQVFTSRTCGHREYRESSVVWTVQQLLGTFDGHSSCNQIKSQLHWTGPGRAMCHCLFTVGADELGGPKCGSLSRDKLHHTTHSHCIACKGCHCTTLWCTNLSDLEQCALISLTAGTYYPRR